MAAAPYFFTATSLVREDPKKPVFIRVPSSTKLILRRRPAAANIRLAMFTLIEYAWEKLYCRRRYLPGLAVLLTVLLLMHGFQGTMTALLQLTTNFLASLVGGGDLAIVTSVLWRTLPLALSAAIITFAIRSEWLHLTHGWSYLWMLGIVSAGAIVGNAVHETMLARRPIISVGKIDPPRDGESLIDHAIRTGNLIGADDSKIRALGEGAGERGQGPGAGADASEPFATLADGTPIGVGIPTPQPKKLSWFAPPDLSQPPGPVPPLFEVKKGQGVVGIILGAISQLLGYLFAYQPRMFFAAILAGSYIGYRLQQRFATMKAVVTGDLSDLSTSQIHRLAA